MINFFKKKLISLALNKWLMSLSLEERAEFFKDQISQLEEIEESFDLPESRFYSTQSRAFSAMDGLRIFIRRLTGYNPGGLLDYIAQYGGDKAGRNAKYTRDLRSENSIFIKLLVDRGSSETQAMKLLMRLRGDKAMTEGHLKELRETYREFKTIDISTHREDDITDNAHTISSFLEFNIDGAFESDEKAAEKAEKAFKKLWQEILDSMREYHHMLKSYDREYPGLFGHTIELLKLDYDNPLDYFYKHPPHKDIPIFTKKSCLREYLNSIGYFKYSFDPKTHL